MCAPFAVLAGELDRSVQYRQLPRMRGEQAAAKFDRIHARLVRKLINEAFFEKRILRMTDRAPATEWYFGVDDHVRHLLIRNLVRMVVQAFDRGFIRTQLRQSESRPLASRVPRSRATVAGR